MKSGDIVNFKTIAKLKNKLQPFMIDTGYKMYNGSVAISMSFSGYEFVKGLPHNTKWIVLKIP